MAMGNRKKPVTRLTRHDWVQAALNMLADGGIAAVRVSTIATDLGITSGSFYHHFKDKKELFHEMLEFWFKNSTTEVRADITALELDGIQSLETLHRLIEHRSATSFDVAIRSWALHDPTAQEVVAKTDNVRLEFIRNQFRKIGFEGLDLENRSRLFLYYETMSLAFFDRPDEETAQQLNEIRMNFLTARPENPI